MILLILKGLISTFSIYFLPGSILAYRMGRSRFTMGLVGRVLVLSILSLPVLMGIFAFTSISMTFVYCASCAALLFIPIVGLPPGETDGKDFRERSFWLSFFIVLVLLGCLDNFQAFLGRWPHNFDYLKQHDIVHAFAHYGFPLRHFAAPDIVFGSYFFYYLQPALWVRWVGEGQQTLLTGIALHNLIMAGAAFFLLWKEASWWLPKIWARVGTILLCFLGAGGGRAFYLFTRMIFPGMLDSFLTSISPDGLAFQRNTVLIHGIQSNCPPQFAQLLFAPQHFFASVVCAAMLFRVHRYLALKENRQDTRGSLLIGLLFTGLYSAGMSIFAFASYVLTLISYFIFQHRRLNFQLQAMLGKTPRLAIGFAVICFMGVALLLFLYGSGKGGIPILFLPTIDLKDPIHSVGILCGYVLFVSISLANWFLPYLFDHKLKNDRSPYLLFRASLPCVLLPMFFAIGIYNDLLLRLPLLFFFFSAFSLPLTIQGLWARGSKGLSLVLATLCLSSGMLETFLRVVHSMKSKSERSENLVPGFFPESTLMLVSSAAGAGLFENYLRWKSVDHLNSIEQQYQSKFHLFEKESFAFPGDHLRPTELRQELANISAHFSHFLLAVPKGESVKGLDGCAVLKAQTLSSSIYDVGACK